MEDLPQRFEQQGRIIFQGRNVIKAFTLPVSGCERVVVVKRYKRPNIVQKTAYSFFRRTKARRAYDNAVELIRRGFSTPVPYAYVETRVHGLIDYCYFVSDVDDNPPISGPLNEAEQFDAALAADYARYVAALHEKGIIDIDLNGGNVLYHPLPDGHYRFSLIDINRMRFYPEGKCPPLPCCMENLTRFTGRMDLFEYVAQHYIEARGLAPSLLGTMMEVKVKHDHDWEKKKNFIRHFNKR